MKTERAHIIGSGPNGLAAAITLAQAGLPVTVYERNASPGGACSTGEITVPGFHHDLGASVFPMGNASPFLRSLPLASRGFHWLHPTAPLAHPLDDGTAVMLESSLDATADNLNATDARAYRHLMTPLIDRWFELLDDILTPPLHWPKHPLLMTRFGLGAIMPAANLARQAFDGTRARALFAGNAAHSVMPLTGLLSSAVGLILSAAAHTTGWPLAGGGAQSLTDTLVTHLKSLGGELALNHEVISLDPALMAQGPVMADITPRQFISMTGSALSPKWQKRLSNFKYGPGAFKIDYALREPIPWTAKCCLRAGTVHLGGTLEQIIESEAAVFGGDVHEAPFVLLVQPSLFDLSRAPNGQHTAWAYCHVPNGYSAETDAQLVLKIEAQIERFAPGFREVVLARRCSGPADLQQWNPNLVGGDLSGGAMTPLQLAFRPTRSLYRAGDKNLYLCGSSTPPGGGVHGMCGYLAAQEALKHL